MVGPPEFIRSVICIRWHWRVPSTVFVDFFLYSHLMIFPAAGSASRRPPRYDVSVLFQGDKEFCPHYVQAVRAGRIAGPAHPRCRGIARCMCIRKCRCRDSALSSDGTVQTPAGKGFANSPGTVAEGAGPPVAGGGGGGSRLVRDEPNHAGCLERAVFCQKPCTRSLRCNTVTESICWCAHACVRPCNVGARDPRPGVRAGNSSPSRTTHGRGPLMTR